MDNSVKDARFLAVGTILTGRYEIQGVIGAGGFGITYKAYDNFMDCIVAIKEYYPAGIVNRIPGQNTISICTEGYVNEFNKGKKRFLSEAKDLYKFKDSPNIVSVQNFFEENMTAYMAMEYLEGCTLGQYVKNLGGRLDVDSTLYVMNKLMEALSELHQAGIIHRDISPDNIFITNDMAVKLIDFGAAKQAYCGETQNLSIMLKPGYAPAEQYSNNSHQSAWTDIYAVGATMYKVLTGVKPVESISRVLNDDLAQPVTLNPQIPVYLNNAIVKAMAVRPEDRFQSIKDFKNAIFATTANNSAYDNQTVRMNAPVTEQGTILINNDSYTNNSVGMTPVAQPQFNYVQPAVNMNLKTGSNYTNGGNNGNNKPKRKKTGLIVALVCLAICLICGGTFAVVKLTGKSDKKSTTEKTTTEKKTTNTTEELASSEDEKNTENTTENTTQTTTQNNYIDIDIPDPDSNEVLYIYERCSDVDYLLDAFLDEYPQYEDNFQIEILYYETESEFKQAALNSMTATGKWGLVYGDIESSSLYYNDSNFTSIDSLGITEDMYSQACLYTKNVVTKNNKIYGMAYELYPGVMVYRTDIAEAVFGTSDPDVISDMMVTREGYLEAAAQLQSAGYYMNSSLDEYKIGSLGDSYNQEFIDQISNNGYSKNTTIYFDGWYDDMNGNVFSYYGTSWSKYIFPVSSGNWQICDAPDIFVYGGSMFYIPATTAGWSEDMYDLARFFLYVTCCDYNFMLDYSTDYLICPNNYSVLQDLEDYYYNSDPDYNYQDPYPVYRRAFYWLDYFN